MVSGRQATKPMSQGCSQEAHAAVHMRVPMRKMTGRDRRSRHGKKFNKCLREVGSKQGHKWSNLSRNTCTVGEGVCYGFS